VAEAETPCFRELRQNSLPKWQQKLGYGRKRDRNRRHKKVRYVDDCRHDRGTLAYWKRESPDQLHLAPARCGSWRHKNSPCALAWGRQAFVRIKQAMERRGEGWVYLVLGFRLTPNGSPSFNPSSPEDAYRAMKDMGEKFRRLLKRRYAQVRRDGKYVQVQPFEYIEVVERHKSGYPHNNMLVWCPPLYELCKDGGWKEEQLRVRGLQVESGYGEHVSIEPVRNVNALASYFSKLVSHDVGAAAGEFSKSYQVPDNAPVHFRRLRASRGTLPSPAESSGEWTGTLVTQSVDDVVKVLVLSDDKAEMPEILIEEAAIDVKAKRLAEGKAKSKRMRELREQIQKTKLAAREAG